MPGQKKLKFFLGEGDTKNKIRNEFDKCGQVWDNLCMQETTTTTKESKMEKGLLISVDGLIEWKEIEVGNSYELLRNAVGGWIECANVEHNIDIWLNEEGKLIGLEPNRLATALFWDKWGIGTDIIVGDVFLATNNEEGETIGLNKEQIDYLQEFVGVLV